jgi:hypothetical protein
VTRRGLLARALVVAAALLAASCSGDSSDSDSADASAPTTVATSTSRPDPSSTTSTSVAASSTTTTSSTEPGVTSTTIPETTTTVPPGPTYPLTGLPMVDETVGYRAALVVKIDNHPQARPQSGLNQADIVFEENVERLTRFAAVFQSGDADPVGPIRSGRTQDIDLLGSLNRPMFAWSGGNANVTRAIRASDLVDLSWTVAGDRGGFRRIRSRGVDTEHTLYASTPLLFANFTPLFAPPPPPQFTYRPEGQPAAGGEATRGADVAMDGVAVTWEWDAAAGQYVRLQGGRPHMVNDGTQVNAANVVVLELEYRPSPADARSPEAQTTGAGTVHVLTGGVMVEGTWERNTRLDPFTLKALDGSVIALTPGRTWVELSRAGSTTPLL